MDLQVIFKILYKILNFKGKNTPVKNVEVFIRINKLKNLKHELNNNSIQENLDKNSLENRFAIITIVAL